MVMQNEATCRCGAHVNNIPDYLADIDGLWLCAKCTGEYSPKTLGKVFSKSEPREFKNARNS